MFPNDRQLARRRRGRLWISLGALPVGLVACEIAVRALGWQPAPQPERSGSVLRKSDDPILRFENRPGGVKTVRYREREGGPTRTVEMRVNAQAFRGPEVARDKPEGTHRVACIGDSHTFGDGVADDETWPAHLQRLSDELGADGRTEVLNCGVNAYDTLQEVRWMQRAVLQFDPDLVLLQYYVNDTAARLDAKRPREKKLAPDALMKWTHPRRGGWFGSLREISALSDLVADGIYRWRAMSQYSELRFSGYEPDHPGWLRVEQGLREARDVLSERDIDFAVVLFPFLLQRGERLTSHRAFERVRELCQREGIACFDAERAFLGRDLPSLRVHPQDYHANSKGNEIFAAAVAGWLANREAAISSP